MKYSSFLFSVVIISYLSNLSSNSFNFFSNFTFISINLTKFKGASQPTLESLGQFLLTNMKIFKINKCNQHLLVLVSNQIKKTFCQFLFMTSQCFTSIEYNDFLSYSLTIEISSSQSMNEDTKQIFFKLQILTLGKTCCEFIFSYFL